MYVYTYSETTSKPTPASSKEAPSTSTFPSIEKVHNYALTPPYAGSNVMVLLIPVLLIPANHNSISLIKTGQTLAWRCAPIL